MENLRDSLEELNLLGFGMRWWKNDLDWSQLKSLPKLKTLVGNKWLKTQLPHIKISDNKNDIIIVTPYAKIYDDKVWEINAKQFNALHKTPFSALKPQTIVTECELLVGD